jgi:hypothetical protein
MTSANSPTGLHATTAPRSSIWDILVIVLLAMSRWFVQTVVIYKLLVMMATDVSGCVLNGCVFGAL